jgi:transposase-like protein
VTIILAGIRSLADHLHTMQVNPEAYRPEQCPCCAHGPVWNHGCYTRKADRENFGSANLNHIPIPRFLCPGCRTTCSVLPEVIPPRRWYLWSVQQAVLLLLLAGKSCFQASEIHNQHPWWQTIRRWRQRLHEQFTVHAATLRPWFPELGRTPEFGDFWSAALALKPLSALMTLLYQEAVAVP